MKHLTQFILGLGVCLGISLSCAAAAPSDLLATHTAKGVACAQCHAEKKSQKAVNTSTCLTCHGSHEALAAKTKAKDPNPHFTHMGDMNCKECHNIHKPSVNQCATCHTIPMQVP
ncbi:MAG: cytochrome c3 family protein [Burkholderiaceae bacterium]